MIEGAGSEGDNTVGQGDVGGDHQVAGTAEFHDAVVGPVGSLGDEKVFDGSLRSGAEGDGFVGDDDAWQIQACDRPQKDRLEETG